MILQSNDYKNFFSHLYCNAQKHSLLGKEIFSRGATTYEAFSKYAIVHLDAYEYRGCIESKCGNNIAFSNFLTGKKFVNT